MCKQYHTIRTSEDIERFQDVSNGLHDGHITHVEYNNKGMLDYDYTKLSLVIHVFVTSLPEHPTFEIFFRNVCEWQINIFHFSDMIEFSIRVLEGGRFLWADCDSNDINDLKKSCYVVAEEIQYRRIS